MNTCIVRPVGRQNQDSKMFRAYGVGNRSLGVSASTTGNPTYAVLRCAAKAFKKFADGGAELDELETRIALTAKTSPTGAAFWEATLQPKAARFESNTKSSE